MFNKNLILGLGIGIILSSGVFYVGFKFTDNLPPSPSISISDDEIIKRAKEIGMIFEDEISKKAEDPKPNNSSLDLEAETTNVNKIEPSIETLTVPIDESESIEDIISEAKESDTINDQESTEIESTKSQAKITNNQVKSNSSVVNIRILPNSSATKVAQNLYNLGLIDNKTNFINYIKANNKANTIRAGYFSIKKGSSYDDILKILSTPSKKKLEETTKATESVTLTETETNLETESHNETTESVSETSTELETSSDTSDLDNTVEATIETLNLEINSESES